MNIDEINGAIRTIADTFKNPSQQLKLIEELGELTREISKDIATIIVVPPIDNKLANVVLSFIFTLPYFIVL